MKYTACLREGEALLRKAGCPEAEADARELLLFAADLSLPEYGTRLFEEVPAETERRYNKLLLERAARKPLAYITERAPFYGRYFFVSPEVLIPGYDTETLIEEALSHLKSGFRVLDLCTGSGCIPVTLCLEGPSGCAYDASDISPGALCVAAKNAEKYGAGVNFIFSNLFAAIDGFYDIITANPPYVESDEIPGLMEEVSCYEPRLALDGGPDGLAFYRAISGEAGRHLVPGGRLILEIGFRQAEAVAAILKADGYEDVRVLRDLAGRDRVLSAVFGQVFSGRKHDG
ncbi:MAG: peptide chain release factor N(5)-glutamine methyltransferase [Lachnospiraceae bacterium]|nr:peptide chain release factor N(5)-glutamine methyltransferase [Lachnospiraceae bacterium]